MLAYIFWNPKREIVIIPYINQPIVWYGFFFALGFFIAYWISLQFIRRLFKDKPFFLYEDITDWNQCLSLIQKKRQESSIHQFLQVLAEPFREKVLTSSASKPLDQGMKKSLLYGLNHTIKQEGFAQRERLEVCLSSSVKTLEKKIVDAAEKLFYHIVVATVIGARLGHLLFYESPTYYLLNPSVIFKTWEGGLASHGALLGLFLGVAIYRYRYKDKYPQLSFLKILDVGAAGGILAGAFIRVGNFFNQEILGRSTQVAWGIIFGSPADGGAIVPRHPAQLYEAFFYFLLSLVLVALYKKKIWTQEGKYIGLCVTAVFVFRFLIEFFKENQSVYDGSFFNMGQLLSVPFILCGVTAFFLHDFQKSRFPLVLLKK